MTQIKWSHMNWTPLIWTQKHDRNILWQCSKGLSWNLPIPPLLTMMKDMNNLHRHGFYCNSKCCQSSTYTEWRCKWDNEQSHHIYVQVCTWVALGFRQCLTVCGFCQLPSQFDNTSDNVTTSASCYQLGVLKRSKFLIFFSCLITFILAGIHFWLWLPVALSSWLDKSEL